MPLTFSPQVVACELAQLVINQRHEAFKRSLITVAPVDQQLRDPGGGGHRKPSFRLNIRPASPADHALVRRWHVPVNAPRFYNKFFLTVRDSPLRLRVSNWKAEGGKQTVARHHHN